MPMPTTMRMMMMRMREWVETPIATRRTTKMTKMTAEA
jgi:hypothetical protein